jgi:hypothetical protein
VGGPRARTTSAAAARLAAIRPRSVARERLTRLRNVWLSVAQVGVAAGAAYLIAKTVVGHGSPFFAPIAAVLTLGLSVGQRGRRAVELGIGVALGIAVADLLVLAIGTGAWQLALIVALAMSAGVLAGGGTLLVNQAAVSAVLVTALPASGVTGARFVDALIGASVALLANAITPTHPIRMVRRELGPLLIELAEIFDRLADALETRDRGLAEQALSAGRADEHLVGEVRSALMAARETTVLAPPRRGSRDALEGFTHAIDPIDFAWRNARVLARNTLRAIDLEDRAPPRAIHSMRLLGDATRALRLCLWDEQRRGQAEDLALEAAREATAALADTSNLSVSAIVSQVRSLAVDLLRAAGSDDEAAVAAVQGVGASS